MTLTVSTFYKFAWIEDPAALQQALLDACKARAIMGSILLAHEGINGTVSGEAQNLACFFAWLGQDPRFAGVATMETPAKAHPFGRTKVKIKREIVTFGVPEANPARAVGIYVEPRDWNALIERPGVVLVDTRNHYEVKIGTFKGAIDPKTRAFRQFPAFVRGNLDPARHPEVAMFCTGGIRCEKATSFLLQEGFKEVYHLQGGILNYLETVPVKESLWEGECFVFDERVSLTHGTGFGTFHLCRSCGGPVRFGSAGQSGASAGFSCEECRERLSGGMFRENG